MYYAHSNTTVRDLHTVVQTRTGPTKSIFSSWTPEPISHFCLPTESSNGVNFLKLDARINIPVLSASRIFKGALASSKPTMSQRPRTTAPRRTTASFLYPTKPLVKLRLISNFYLSNELHKIPPATTDVGRRQMR